MDYKKLNRMGYPKLTSLGLPHFGRHLFFSWKFVQTILVWVSGYPLPLISLLCGECHTKPGTCWALSAESAVFRSSLPRGQVGKVLHGTGPWFSSLNVLRGLKATFPAYEERVLSCPKVSSPGSWTCWKKEYPIHRTSRSTFEKELVAL